MASNTYDIITIGGGLAGAALAKVMAEAGARVLVLEAEEQFKDRVRGEAMLSWGVAESKELGIYDTLIASGGHLLPYWNSYFGGKRTGHRDLTATTTVGNPALGFYHPRMQEGLLEAAEIAGAHVVRGARVRNVAGGGGPVVNAGSGGTQTQYRARLVVAADGRSSLVRRLEGFHVQQDPDGNLVAGILFEGMQVDENSCHFLPNPSLGLGVLLFPQGDGQVRGYLCYRSSEGYRLSGSQDLPRFIDGCVRSGAPAEFYTEATTAGPLATFDGAASWVPHPYNNGIALIGDAAAANDPTWGQGLSMTVRDVRVLRDQLLRHEDWDASGHAYAEEHDRYRHVVNTVENWMTQVLMVPGEEADVLRTRVLSLWREDHSRNPDTFFNGPDHAVDELVRRRFFGED